MWRIQLYRYNPRFKFYDLFTLIRIENAQFVILILPVYFRAKETGPQSCLLF